MVSSSDDDHEGPKVVPERRCGNNVSTKPHLPALPPLFVNAVNNVPDEP